LSDSGSGHAAEIALSLATTGMYRTTIDALPTQRIVDLQWNAHDAGLMLGIKVRVSIEPHGRDLDQGHHRATVTVTERHDVHHSWPRWNLQPHRG
jgi:hypothetical protein